MACSFIKQLPNEEQLSRILELAEHRLPAPTIAERVLGSAARTKLIAAVIAAPDRFDPIVDEVAVSRALQGDGSVWDSLTHYERREVMLRIHARREAERIEDAEDEAGFAKIAEGPNYVRPNGRTTPAWLQTLADGFRVHPRRLLGEAKDYAEVMV